MNSLRIVCAEKGVDEMRQVRYAAIPEPFDVLKQVSVPALELLGYHVGFELATEELKHGKVLTDLDYVTLPTAEHALWQLAGQGFTLRALTLEEQHRFFDGRDRGKACVRENWES